MTGFKKDLLRRFAHCLISKAHCRESDGVHIIHRFVCRELNRKDLIHNSFNGLLLFSGLHRSYDNYVWTLDIFSLDFKSLGVGASKGTFCDLKVIVSPEHKGYFIDRYAGQTARVPINSLPYLWVDYQVFVDYNFYGITERSDLLANYQKYMSSSTFSDLVADPIVGLSRLRMGSGRFPRAVIQYNLCLDHYLILGDRAPWSDNRWVTAETLSKEDRENFHELREKKEDTDFKPRPRKRKLHHVKATDEDNSENLDQVDRDENQRSYGLRKRAKIDYFQVMNPPKDESLDSE